MVTVAIFIILFVVILSTLQAVSMFGRMSRVVLALCVSLLCIIGLLQSFFPSPGHSVMPSETPTEIEIVTEPLAEMPDEDNEQRIYFLPLLLPYGALAVTLLLSPLALLFAVLRKGKCWKQIVHASRKLSATNADIEKKDFRQLNSNHLLRRPRNEKTKIKSTSKDIHV